MMGLPHRGPHELGSSRAMRSAEEEAIVARFEAAIAQRGGTVPLRQIIPPSDSQRLAAPLHEFHAVQRTPGQVRETINRSGSPARKVGANIPTNNSGVQTSPVPAHKSPEKEKEWVKEGTDGKPSVIIAFPSDETELTRLAYKVNKEFTKYLEEEIKKLKEQVRIWCLSVGSCL